MSIVSACVLLMLTACAKQEERQPYDPAVAATVNGSAISVRQIELALQQTNVARTDAKVAAKLVLDRLIDQELVLQKALEQKLDRDPDVMPLIEAARRNVLQRAYLDRVANEVEAPTDADIAAYYRSRPDLFAKRRVYTYRVLAVPASKERWAALQAQLDRVNSLEALIPWLRAQRLPFVASIATRAAEQIPIDALPRISALREGQMTTVSAPEGVEVVQLVSSRVVPFTERQAKASIEQYLLNQRRQARMEEELKTLRASARVEKLGDFSRSSTAGTTQNVVAYGTDDPADEAELSQRAQPSPQH